MILHARHLVVVLAVGAVALVMCGCSDGPKTYPIQVKVLDGTGNPIPHAVVTLKSEDSNLIARGEAGDDGVAEVRTATEGQAAIDSKSPLGAVAGVHKVAVASPPNRGDPDEPSKLPVVFPKYSAFDTSGLQITVETGSNPPFEVKVEAR